MCRKTVFIAVLTAFAAVACNGPKTKEELLKAGTEQIKARKPGEAAIYFKNALEKDPDYTDARYELGKAFLLLGRYDAAEKEFQKLLVKRPGSREARIELARAFAMGGKPEEALKAAARLGGARSDADLLEISGWSHAQKGEYAKAASDLKKAAELQPGRASTIYLLARVYMVSGNMTAARQQIGELLKKDPSHREALYLLADTQVRGKDSASALETYDHIIKTFPGQASGYFRKGLLLLDLGRLDEAHGLSETLIRNFSNRPEGYELKGLVLQKQKKYTDAVSLLQKTLTFKESARLHYLIGLCNFYNQDLEQSRNELRRALDIDPDLNKARIIISLIDLKKNRIDDAAGELEKVLAADDRNAVAHMVMGSIYLGRGWYGRGLAELDRAIELDPALTDARIKKAIFKLSRGKDLEAEKELSEAVRAVPDLLNSRLLLASYYLKRNANVKAIAVAREGLQNLESDAALYNIMADACLREGRTKEAMSALEKARKANAQYAPTYFRMAAVHQLHGEQEKAVALLKTFAGNFPENERAQIVAASMLEKRGNVMEAGTFYERAWKTGTAEGAIECARYYLRNGNPGKAAALLGDSHRKNPSDKLYFAMGQAYLAQKEFKEALRVFEALGRSRPEAGLAAVVNVYFAMNEPEKALERVNRELKAKPERSDIRAELCRVYSRMGKHKKAAENAALIIQQEPRSALGYLTLAMVHKSAHEPDKAIEALQKASHVNDARLATMLGNMYASRGDYPSALLQYEKAGTIRAEYVPAVFQKAVVLEMMKKKKEAINGYRQVIRISPDYLPALNNLAYLLAQDPETAPAALPYAVRACALSPGDGRVQDTLGFALLKNGRVEEGLKALKQAASAAAGNPTIYFHLALALKERGKAAEADVFLRKAISIGDFPEHEKAKTLLQELNRGPGRGRTGIADKKGL